MACSFFSGALFGMGIGIEKKMGTPDPEEPGRPADPENQSDGLAIRAVREPSLSTGGTPQIALSANRL